MAPNTARIRTLADLNNNENGHHSSSSAASPWSKSNDDVAGVPSFHGNPAIHHMLELFESDKALEILKRIEKEFVPIIKARGYNVVSISEMCCCGDGLPRRRRQRPMSLNILGYNQTTWHGGRRGGGKQHSIHLRLRQPRNHNVLFSYEEVAGTMAHELAHCVHGPHNAAFYKLMDQILDQHAILLSKGFVADDDGKFPMSQSAQAHVLGRQRPAPFIQQQQQPNRDAVRRAAAEAAQKRKARTIWMPQGPQTLGGSSGALKSWLTPQMAAGIAAQERKMADDQWCMLCQPASSNEDDNDDSRTTLNAEDEGNNTDNKEGSRKDRKRPPKAIESNNTTDNTKAALVDLTAGDVGNNSGPAAAGERRQQAQYQQGKRRKRNNSNNSSPVWPCPSCTFLNRQPSSCAMCGRPKPQTQRNNTAVIDLT